MTESEIQKLAADRNGLNKILGILMIPLSLLMWWITYWVVRIIAWIILRGFSEILEARWNLGQLSRYIALGSLVLLIVEGVWMMRTAGGIRDYFSLHHTWFGFRAVGTIARDELAGTSYMISHFLFAAPEATLQTIALLSHHLPDDLPTACTAAEVLKDLEDLEADRQWHVHDLYDEKAVNLLHELKLIWAREKDGLAEIRIPPKSG